MGASRLSLKRTLLLSTFFAAALFSTTGFAQDDDESTTPARSTRSTARTTPSTSSSQTPPSTSTTPRTTDTERPPPPGQSTVTTAPSPTDTPDDGDEPMPSLTNPNFAGQPPPTYGPARIPPTNNAPFMNHSTLPDGTVFIVVGAILGAFGITILLWRTIVACLLHRSVERAALAQHVDVNKSAAAFPPPPAPFYKFTDRDSSHSLPAGGLGAPAGARNNRKSHRGPTPSSTPSQTNLFFSPTAAPAGGANASNRDSRFLPSGFYASASPAPAQHGHGNSISLSNLRPSSRGFATGPTPPESPSMRAQSRNISTSSINLNRPPSGRAPSAFLDDLLDDPAYAGQFPTGQPGQGPGPFGPTTGYGQPGQGQGHARY